LEAREEIRNIVYELTEEASRYKSLCNCEERVGLGQWREH